MTDSTSNRGFKDAIYEQLARIGKALAAPSRLELLDLLGQGPRNVESLARQAGLGIANTSKHLRLLYAARLVEADRDGSYVTYRLADQRVADLFRELRTLAEGRLTEIDALTRDFLGAKGAFEEVDGDELAERVRRGEVLVLDVRPLEEFASGHIPGALSIPLGEIETRLRELPRHREIAAYCRGPYCVLAIDAVRLLRGQGFRAVRFSDGVADWRARGFAVEEGEAAP